MEKVNIVAVVVASLVPMIVGSLWYSVLFGKKWMGLIGKSEEEIKKSADPLRMYGGSYVAAFVMAYILAHFVIYANSFTGREGFIPGMTAGFWAWLGFVVTTNAASVFFEFRQPGLYYLNVSYNLVCLLLMGGILSAW
jgi:hypothetical protein